MEINSLEDLKQIKMVVAYEDTINTPPWPHDLWKCKFPGKRVGVEFKTGLGLRVKNRPVAPVVETVLHSLWMDGLAASGSFEDFCAEFGYNYNSIYRHKLYHECQEAGRKLQRILPPEVIEKFTEWFVDY
jgi:hypothetical protein